MPHHLTHQDQGMGADWQLALLNYEDYPYLYHMISIPGPPPHFHICGP